MAMTGPASRCTEEGNPDGPTVVLVHGWPDSHRLWDGVVPLLADKVPGDPLRQPGAGASSVPKKASSYAMPYFADDFAAVIDEVCPGERVHVVAHDWGSAGMWEYVARPDAADRVASFTSVSGPSADHVSRYVRDGLKQPYRPRRRLAHALSQAGHLSYMAGLSVPVLAPAFMRAGAKAYGAA